MSGERKARCTGPLLCWPDLNDDHEEHDGDGEDGWLLWIFEDMEREEEFFDEFR